MKTRTILLLSLIVTALTLPLAKGTTLISPTGDGGFESGFGAWTVINGASGNKWFTGTAAGAAAGTNAAFVGSSSSTYTDGVTQSTSVVNFMYMDIPFPAGETSISLSFSYKQPSLDATFDNLKVFLVPTSTTPVAGTPLSSGQIGATEYPITAQATFGSFAITLPGSAAGTTQRLVFQWKNDSASPYGSGAIDSISLTSVAPTLISGTKTVGTGGDFATLAAAATFLNANGVNGPLILELLPTYTSGSETFPITFNNISGNSGTNTITVRPQTGATALSISGSNTTATIDLNGAQNVILDGRPGGTGTLKQLTIANTSATTTASAVRFINDAISNKLQFCTVTGVNTSTTNGVILFSTTTGANGNDNNTIDSCDIRDGATTPNNGIFSSGTTTTTATNNSGNIISNNNIFNFFNSTAASTGITISSGSTDWTVTGNSFYQTTTRTPTTGATHNGILISNTSGNNFVVTNNFVGGTAPNAGGTAWTVSGTTTTNRFVGIQLSVGTTTPSSVQGNTVANMSLGSSSAATTLPGVWAGIYVSSGSANVGTTSGNTVGSSTGTGSVAVSISTTGGISFGIGSASSGTVAISNNNVGSITVTGTTTSVSHSFVGVQVTSGTNTISANTIGSTATANSINASTASTSTTGGHVAGILSSSATSASITSNTIANLNNAYAGSGTTTFVGQIRGIVTSSGVNTITANTIRNLTTATSVIGTGSGAAANGIAQTSTTAGQTISQNTIHTISVSPATAAAAVQLNGIYYSGASTGTNVITRNFVHSLTTNSTATVPASTGTINGIHVFGGVSTYQNNMVRLGVDATGASIGNGNYIISGIRDNALANNNYYFNSVFIGGTSVTTGTAATHGFIRASTAVTDFRNNIVVNNRSNSTGTGKHYAVNLNTATTFTANFNDYFQNGTGAVFGAVAAVDSVTFANWKSNTSQDASSAFGDPQFITPNGTSSTVDLHIHPTNATPIEAAGVLIATITDDFDGQTRSTLTPTDIGADSGNFVGADLTPPSITYAPLGNTGSTSARTLTATITDNSGVPTSGVGLPVLYWKVNAGSYTSAQGSFIGSNQYQFSLGSGVNVGDTVSYYVVAEDTASPPNVTSNPSGGASGFTADPPAAGTPPTTPNSYTIVQSIAGSFTVGSGGNYANIGAAVADLNSKILTGPVTMSLTDATYSGETLPITINANPGSGATNTITIKPSATSTIGGSLSSNSVFKLNGCSYVTIDGSNNGSSSRNLTITNTNTTAPTVISIVSLGTGAGATNNTIKNCNLSTGVATSVGYGVSVGGSTPGTSGADNDNNTIQNNNITVAPIGIYANGTASVSTGGDDNLAITGNSIDYNNTTTGLATIGIQLGNALNSSISGNSVSEQTSSIQAPTGISLETGFVSSTVNANTVTKALTTNTGGYGGRGITVGTGTASSALTISNNVVYGVNGSNFSGFSNSSSMGIAIGMIGNSSTITTTAGGIGLFYNSVNMTGSMGAGSSSAITTAFYVGSGASALDVRDNVLVNTQVGTSTTQKNYAIFSAASSSAFTTINYNDYFVSNSFNAGSAIPGNIGAIDRTNLAGIQLGFGGNTNSQIADPLFNSATNLAPQTGSPAVAAGTPIAGITTDFTGASRSGSTPSEGAYENPTDSAPPTIVYSPLGNTTGTGARTLTATITDASGVPTSGVGLPVLYWKVNAGSYTSAQGSFIGSNQYQFSLGSGVSTGDTVSYYVVAQDSASPANVIANPSTGAGGYASNPPAAATPPTTPNSYTILQSISGSFNVGTGGTYTTITAAVADLNSKVITAPVTFNLTDTTYPTETFPITINANGGSSVSNTLTIKPASGQTVAVSGSSITSIFKLNGCSFVTIDGSNNGSSSRNLTIANTNTSTSGNAVVWLASATASQGATSNTVKNCIITGNASTTTLMGVFSGGTSTISTSANALTANSSNAISNNAISKSQYGVFMIGTSTTTLDSANQVLNNALGTSTAGDGFNIGGIDLRNQTGATVFRNDVQNVASSTSSTNLQGINLQDTKSSTVSANKVHFMNYSGASTTKTYGITTSTSAFTTVGNASANTYVNNFVYDLVTNGTSSLWNLTGINNNGGFGDKYYFNSINLTGSVAAGTGPSAAFANGNGITSTAATNIDVRNNIFNMAASATAAAKLYAHYTTATTYSGSTLNNNDLRSTASGSGTAALGFFNAADRADLAAWQSATTQEANSFSSNPQFTSNTDLHINPSVATIVESNGTPIGGVTTDVDGDTRNVSTPDMGADEGNFIAIVANDVQATAFIDPTNGGSKAQGGAFSPQASFTNNGTANQTNVPVRYRIFDNTNAVVYNQTSTIATLNSGATQTATFPSTTINTAGAYTIKARAELGTDTVPANDEITGTMSIDAPLNGSYNVGSGGDIATLTQTISNLNNVGVSGPVTINLTDASYSTGETFPLILNAVPGASSTNTVTIKPATGQSVTITAATTVIKLNGADFVTIDGSNSGGTDRSMTIVNNDTGTSSAAIWIASASASDGATNNTIKNCIMSGNASTTTVAGILSGSGTTFGGAAETANSTNTIQNNQIFRFQNGVFQSGNATTLDQNWTITGNSIGSTVATDKMGFRGILVQNAQNFTVSNNTIFGVTTVTSSTTTGIAASGMISGGSILANSISDIKNTNTGEFGAIGLWLSATSTTSNLTAANNVIYDVAGQGYASGTGTSDNGYGIYLSAGGGYKLYFNSVRMTTDQPDGGIPAAINISGVTTSASVDLRDNVFANTQTLGTRYAIYSGSASTVYSSINYNDYYQGTGTLGNIAAADVTTIAAWRTATGQDVNSFSSDPKFNSTSDLRPQPTSPLLATGTPAGGITTDFAGVTRSATTPSVGAFENGADVTGPAISYTTLGNTSSTASRTLSPVTVTDSSGVNTTAGTRPRIYFKKSTEPNALAATNTAGATGWKFVQATGAGGSPFSFNINYAIIFGGTVSQGDTIQYFVDAADLATPANVSINSGTFAAAPSSVALTSAAFPIGGTINSYSVLPSISGTKNVGTGGDYPTITAAVAALNGSVLSGALTLNLTDATYGSETYPIVINSNGGSSATNTVTIKPASGQNVTLSATTTLFKLNGADFVTIDGSNNGSTSRNLTLNDNDTGIASAAVWIASASSTDGAANNTIKNCIMSGNASTTTLAGVVGGSGTTIGNPAEGANSTNTIQNNQIFRFQNGIFQNGNASTLSQSWVITGNQIGSAVATDKMGFRGILFENAQNFSVTNNTIVGVTTATTSTASGIVATGTISGGSITGNIIGDITNTNSGGYGAIGLWLNASSTASNLTAANNVIYNVTGIGYDGDTTAFDNGYGIMIDAGGGYKVFFNSVSLSTEETDGLGIPAAVNIGVGVTTANSIDLRDNIFYTAQTLGTPYAVYCSAAATVFSNINYNDYFATAGTLGSFGGLDETTITSWRTATGKDANSISSNPQYNSTTNLQPQLGAPVLAAGQSIPAVTTDILGVTRSATTPSMGAYENGADTVGPAIVYTPLANTSTTGARSLTATVTDASGVPTSGAGLPVLYWKINAGSYTSATGNSIGSNQYQFSFGAGANSSDTVSYYVVAQDSATPANVSANPSTGAGNFTSSPPAAGTPPTTPNTYTILGTLSGGKTIGTGGDYSTITAAVAALNNSVVSGPVTFTLTEATYAGETFPIVINANPGSSATNTVTFKPAASQTTTISGSSSSSIFKLNGASYVIIDGSNSGGTDRSMTVSNTNTSTSSAVIWLSSPSAGSGASNNTIKNCVITGNASTTTLMGIFAGGTSISTSGNALAANSSNTISNNLMSKAQYGVFLLGTSTTTLDSGNQVINNTMGSSTAGDGFQIGGVFAKFQTGATISGNDIQNIVGASGLSDLGGTTIMSGVDLENTKASTVSSNKVHFMNYNGSSTIKVYALNTENTTFNTSGNASANSFVNNMVYDVVSSGASSIWNVSGINNGGGYGDKYYFNSVFISGALSTTSGPSSAFSNGNGITSTAATNIDVRDNIFDMGGSSTGGASLYVHYTTLSSYGGSILNYNDLYVTSANGFVGFFASTNRTALSDWQTATGLEANSISANPLFTSNTNLHISAASSPVANAGTTIAGVTLDLDGETRNATTPYIGADELVGGISTVGTLSAVDTTYGTASTSPTSFSVSGTNLTSNLVVTPPAGFEVSTSSGSGYATSLSLTPSSGTVPSTTVFVRLGATTDVGPYSGNVVCSSAPATPKNVATALSTVSQKALTVTGLTGDTKVYDRTTAATFSGTPVLNGTVNGDIIGLGGSPTAAFTDFNTGTGKTINVTGYTLTGAKAFDYTLTQPTLTADITPKGLTITGLTGNSKVYDRTTAASFSGAPALSGVIAGDTGNVNAGGTPSASFITFDVGTGIVMNVSGYTLTGTRAFNYTLTQPTLSADITPAPLTVAGITGDNKVYDRTTAATFSGTASPSGVISGDLGNVALGGSPTASFSDFNTGTNKTISVSGYTLTGTRAFNYTLTQPTLLTADITAKGLTIAGLTGDNKVYDRTTAATFSGTPVLNGVLTGDLGNVNAGGSPTAAFADFDTGTSKTINVSGYTLTGTRAFNYTLTQPSLTADITPKGLTITGLTGDNKVYDRTTSATFSGTPALNGVFAGDTGNVNVGGTPSAAFVSFDVGTGIVMNVSGYTLTGSRAFNYTVGQPTLTANITPKALTITGIAGDNKVYDRTTTATFTGTAALNGVIGGDNPNVVLGGTPTASFVNFDAGTNKTINVSGYTVSGSRAFNYTVTQPTLTADITPKGLTITGLTGNNKVYNRTTTATFTGTPVLNGVVTGDTANVGVAGTPTASFGDFNVGTNKTITVVGFTLTGTRGFNYTLTQPTLTADITPKSLGITADSGQSKTKGASDPTFTYSSSGLISPDALSGALSRIAGETPGTYAITIGSLDAGTNYSINFTDALFAIAGPLAAADQATRPNAATSFNIPLATLLANDSRIGTDGNGHTDQLSVSGVTSGTGNTVIISGPNVVYTPTDPNDTTDTTFTYTLLDSATGTTDTGTVTVHTDTGTGVFTLDIDDVVSPASFNGTNTSITVAFLSSPNETVTLEYTTDLVTWTTVSGTFNTGSGSFQATITAPGNLAAQWNAGMFFRGTNQ